MKYFSLAAKLAKDKHFKDIRIQKLFGKLITGDMNNFVNYYSTVKGKK